MSARSVDRLLVRQRVEALEMLTGFETKNRYSVQVEHEGGAKQEIFFMQERSSCFQRSCWCAPAPARSAHARRSCPALRVQRPPA